jgi:iron(III) transport system permease protein
MLWTSLQKYYAVPSRTSLRAITFEAFTHVFTSPTISGVWPNTALVGAGTAALTMVLGLLVAWILVRTRSRLRVVLDFLAFMSQALPGVIGVSVLLLYRLLPLPLYGTIWIIMIGLTTQFIALSTRIMSSGIVQA